MGGQLHQMTVEYVTEQDRLLLRFSTREGVEIGIWLTRGIVRALWRAIVGVFAEREAIKAQTVPGVGQAMMSMEHDQAVQSADFSQPRDERVKPHPEIAEPPLVTGFKCRQRGDRTQMTFTTEAGGDVNLGLPADGVHALCHLLQAAAEKAEWDLGLAFGDDGGARIH